MPGHRGPTSKATHVCNCKEYCRGIPQLVSKGTYYAHSKYRNLPPPNPSPPSLLLPNAGSSSSSSASSAASLEDTSIHPTTNGDHGQLEQEPPEHGANLPENMCQEEPPVVPIADRLTGEDGWEGDLYEEMPDQASLGPGTVPAADAPAPILPPPANVPGPAPPSLPQQPPEPLHPSACPAEYVIPEDFSPNTEELRVALAFKRALENASLDNGDLDEDEVYLLRNPVTEAVEIDDRDIITSIKLFLSLSNVPDQTYKNVIKIMIEDSPRRNLLSHARVKKKLAELTGIHAIVKDMCPSSCVAYMGPYEELEQCPLCDTSRYDEDKPGMPGRQHFYTIPIGFFLQALWRSRTGAYNMRYRHRETEKIVRQLLESLTRLIPTYNDVFHGSDAFTK